MSAAQDFRWNGERYAAANGLQTSTGKRLIDSIRFSPAMSVLDAGCGSGELTFLLARQVPDGHVTGIDASGSMIRRAEASLRIMGLNNLAFQACDINGIEWRESFDLVFSNSVLHWVTEIEDGVRRFYRALKPGGTLAAQFPLLNAGHPLIRYAGRAAAELGLEERYDGWAFPWYVPESAEAFEALLTAAGFENAGVTPEADTFSFPSAEAVFRHFESVGLSLFAGVLEESEKERFFRQVLRDLTADHPHGASLRYERLFVRGDKP
ncbi:MAG: methyltransferase domain-containing protein [Oscillospiraceae bacterium]|nr:methyltransferase domain-containing protein [Oscillospiraceae bacterium]